MLCVLVILVAGTITFIPGQDTSLPDSASKRAGISPGAVSTKADEKFDIDVPYPPPIFERIGAEANRLIAERQLLIKGNMRKQESIVNAKCEPVAPFNNEVLEAALLKELKAAIKYFEAATGTEPNNYKAWLGLGRIQARMYYKDAPDGAKRLSEAIASLHRAKTLAPTDPAAYNDLSSLLAGVDKSESALAVCDELMERLPHSAAGYSCAGYVYYYKQFYGRTDERISYFIQAARLEPDNADVIGDLANSYRASGRYSDAVATYRRALKLNPTRVIDYESLAYVLEEIGNYTEALSVARQLIALKPQSDNGYSLAGRIYLFAKNYPEAVKACKKAIGISPERFANHLLIARAYSEVGRYDEAAAAYLESIRVQRESFFARFQYEELGGLYMKTKQYALAIKAFNDVIRLYPEDSSAYAYLGDIQRKLNEPEKAIKYYKKAIESAKNNLKERKMSEGLCKWQH